MEEAVSKGAASFLLYVAVIQANKAWFGVFYSAAFRITARPAFCLRILVNNFRTHIILK